VRFEKFSCSQDIQMKRKRGSGQLETASYFACRKAFGGILDEQTENTKARFLRESSEGIYGGGRFHISKSMEI